MANTVQLNLTVKDDGSVVLGKFVDTAKKGSDEVARSATASGTALGGLSKAADAAFKMVAAFGGAAIASAGTALVLAERAAQAGDEAYILGQQLGISASKASEMAYAAESSGSSTEALASAMRTLALKASDAASGNKEAAASFGQIGLSVDDVNPKLHSMDEIFRTVVDAMARYREDGNKTSAGTEILGRSFVELKPAIEGGSAAFDEAGKRGREMGVVFSDEAAAAAHELNNSFDDLRSMVKGLSNTIGVDLFPIVSQAVSATTGWISENRELIAVKVKAFIDGVVEAAEVLGPIIIRSADAALELFDRLAKLNPELQNFAFAAGAAVVGGGAVASSISSIADTAVKTTDTVINLATNIKALAEGASVSGSAIGLLGFGLAALGGYAASTWLEIERLNAQSERLQRIMGTLPTQVREAAEAFNDNVLTISVLNARLQEVNSRLETARKAGRDTSGAIRELTAEQQELEGSLRTLRGEQENANDALTRAARESREARNESVALRDAVDDLFGKSKLSAEGMGLLATKSGIAADHLRDLDTGAVSPTDDDFAKLAKTLKTSEEAVRRMGQGTRSVVPPIKGAGDAAAKTAEALAQLAAQSAQFAAAQLDQAVATGDLTRTQEAYQVALDKAAAALKANLAVADAAAAAGKSEAEVTALRTKAEQDFATAANAAADKVGAAYQREQNAQEALAATTADLQVAHDLEALAAANAAQVGAVYAKTVEDIEAANRQAVDAIEAKRGATLNDAEAEKAIAEANEKTRQQLAAAEQQYRATAEAADAYGAVIDQVAETLADRSLDLGFALLTGQASWKDAAKHLADIFGSTAIDAIKDILKPGLVDFFKGLAQPLLQGLGSTFASLAPNELAPAIAGATSNGAAVSAALGAGAKAGATMATGFGSFMASAGPVALAAAGVAIFADGISNIVGGDLDKGLMEAAIAVPGFGVAALVVDKLLYAFGVLGPNMEHRIAALMGKWIGQSLQDPEVAAAVQAGSKAIGDFTGESLVKAMTKIPVSELHKGIHDVVTEAFAGESAAVQTEIQQLAQAAGTAVSAQLGKVGGEAIAFSQAWAASWIRAQVDAGHSAEEIIRELEAMDKALGTGGGIFAALDELNAKIVETGKSGEVFKDLGAIIKDWTGKKTDVQSFSDVLAAFGGDAVLTLNAIKKSIEDNGIAIEEFGGDLGDVVLAFTGAGESIQAATEDYRKFGNEADGTAQILRDEVLRGLDDVIASAKDFPTESVQAFGSAVGMISPEMLRSSEFTKKLRNDFAQMAAASHMSVRDLVNSIDPPLPDALKKAILSTNGLGKALGALSGAPLSSIKEVTDRMKQFAGDMYREVKDETGKTTKVLTTFGEQTVGDLVNAVGGMWDTITEDGVIATGEIDDVFHQIGMIPEEVFNDPAVQDAVHSLLAKIGEQTGDATLIALAASTTITKEQLDAATAQYDQWVKDHPPPPPPATTPTDGSTPTDGTTPGDTTAPAGGPADTSAASETPPPQPIPPETQKSWDDLTASAVEYAKAVTEGRDAVVGLATDAVTSAATMLAAFTPVYGTPNDERSLSAIRWLLTTLTDDFLGQSGNIAGDFDKIRGAVNQLHTAVDDLSTAISDVPTDKTITFHIVQDGDIPPGGDDGGGGEGHAAGHWKVPGPVGQPYRTILHGGERVLSVEEDREYQRIRFGAADAAAATAGPMAYATPPSGSSSSGRAPSPRAVAREVARMLTSDGSVRWLGVPASLNVDDLARFVVLEALPRYSSARLVTADPRTGVIRRDSSMPGRG